MSDWLSTCCTATHDESFHYDEDNNEGLCVDCKDHATFEEAEYE